MRGSTVSGGVDGTAQRAPQRPEWEIPCLAGGSEGAARMRGDRTITHGPQKVQRLTRGANNDAEPT
jgi:hypothetical protein